MYELPKSRTSTMIEYILYERYYKMSELNQQLNNLRIYNYNNNTISKKSKIKNAGVNK